MGKTGEEKFGDEGQALGIRHVKCEMPTRHPRGDAEEAAR